MYTATTHSVRQTLTDSFDAVEPWFDRPPEVRSYRPLNGGWTIDEILEHITLTSHFLLIIIRKGVGKAVRRSHTQQPADGESDLHFMSIVCDTGNLRWAHPEHMTPTGAETPDAVRSRMHQQRLECLALLDSIPHGIGSLHTVRMSVGELGKIDMYQWLYFLALHIQRHLAQMNSNLREQEQHVG